MVISPVVNLTDVRGEADEIVPFISYSVIRLMSNGKTDDSSVDFLCGFVSLATMKVLSSGMGE